MDAEQTTSAPTERTWRDRWQIPGLAAAVVLLMAGLVASLVTAPEPDIARMLAQVERLVEEGEAERALEALNEEIAPVSGSSAFGERERARFHLARARAMALTQRELGIESEENHKRVVEEFDRATAAGAELTANDRYLLGRSLIEAGMFERARETADSLMGVEGRQRSKLYRRMVDLSLQEEQIDEAEVRGLLSALLRDPKLSEDDEAWAIAKEAELLVEAGLYAEAQDEAFRGLIWLEGAERESRAWLYVLLGRAMVGEGKDAEARAQIEKAMELAGEGSPVHGWALVEGAGIEVRAGAVETGREMFRRAMAGHPGTAIEAWGLLGVADAEARLGNDGASRERFEELTRLLAEGRPSGRLSRETVLGKLLEWHQRRLGEGDAQGSLEFAELAEGLYGGTEPPAAVLRAMADANRAVGERIVREAVGEGREEDVIRMGEGLSELAVRRYRAAGAYYRAHAERMVLEDPGAYQSSLWLAADSFDRAGDSGDALSSFAEYASAFPADARRAEARFRSARLLQAQGEYGLASVEFEKLIEESRDLEAGKNVGPYGPASYVPLAQCYLLDTSPENDAEAERVLLRALSGAIGSPESQVYHDALLEIGKVYYDAGRYAEAIERLREALERYPDDPAGALVRFRLADSYRRDALSIRERLATAAFPDDERTALSEQAREQLSRARELFDEVVHSLSAVEGARLTPVERAYLRNSYFYRADCAFEMGDLPRAIHDYVEARDRYAGDPASLVAMIQIVHAHMRLGQIEEARTANDRARRFYKSLPASAWDDPSLPLRREDWERWLDSMDRLTSVPEGK